MSVESPPRFSALPGFCRLENRTNTLFPGTNFLHPGGTQHLRDDECALSCVDVCGASCVFLVDATSLFHPQSSCLVVVDHV